MKTAILLLGVGVGLAGLGVGDARAQVVQLPSFGQTGVSTTVVVPDRGSAYLGGVQRGAMGSRTQGVPLLGNVPGAGPLFRNRAAGSSLAGSSFTAHATIIDLAEMDRELLNEASRGRKPNPDAARIAEKAAFLSKHVARRPEAQRGKPGAR